MPGPTIIGVQPVSFFIAFSNVSVIDGTTDDITAPSIVYGSIL